MHTRKELSKNVDIVMHPNPDDNGVAWQEYELTIPPIKIDANDVLRLTGLEGEAAAAWLEKERENLADLLNGDAWANLETVFQETEASRRSLLDELEAARVDAAELAERIDSLERELRSYDDL